MNSVNKILNKFFKNNNYYVLKDLNSKYIGCSESVYACNCFKIFIH